MEQAFCGEALAFWTHLYSCLLRTSKTLCRSKMMWKASNMACCQAKGKRWLHGGSRAKGERWLRATLGNTKQRQNQTNFENTTTKQPGEATDSHSMTITHCVAQQSLGWKERNLLHAVDARLFLWMGFWILKCARFWHWFTFYLLATEATRTICQQFKWNIFFSFVLWRRNITTRCMDWYVGLWA